jgi:Tol biopolymer transport system component
MVTLTRLAVPRSWLAAVAVVTIALAAPSAATASYPGRNGRIAFDNAAMLTVSPRGSLGPILGSGYHPRHSRSGRMVAYGCGTDQSDSCPAGVGIRIRRADGRGRWRRITRNHWDDYPDWSPGGHRIVFTRYPRGELTDPELWIYHRGHSRRLTLGSQAAWSVKGEIVFIRFGDVPGEPWDIYVIRPDGSQLRRLGPGFAPEWSPTGRRIIYASNGCGYSCLYTMRRDGSRNRRVGKGISGDEPDFSPDGRRVVFHSPGSADQIVVMRPSGRGQRVLFQAAGDLIASYPDWQSVRRRPNRRRTP